LYSLKLFESATRAVTNVTRKHANLSSNPEDADDDEESAELFTVCSQLAAEDDLLEPVNTALTLWEDGFGSKLCDQTCLDCELSETTDYLEVMVLVYKLMQVTNIVLSNLIVPILNQMRWCKFVNLCSYVPYLLYLRQMLASA
jgi:hypothetical protein